jgi:dTDP-3,4-didehydro-2,6-dideoxy-alpha-D-glucose 3-reductase
MNINGITVWGIGNHVYKRIIPAILNIKELNLIGVCSRSHSKIESLRAELLCKGWTNYNDMFQDVDVDVVYISTPIGIHFEQAKTALELKKNVWCEKPLTNNFNHTKILIELAKKNNKMLSEAFMFLYHPQFKKIKNIVNNKEYGKVHSIVCRFGIPKLEEPGFRENVKLGGGAFWDVGSYTVAAVLELFEDQNVEILFSELLKDKKTLLDNQGRAILRFSQGTIAYLEWGVGVAYKNEIDLWAEKGSFYTDKIFSKPDKYLPVYRMRNKYGEEELINGKNAEQFEEMFKVFSNILNSPHMIEDEYKRIYKRAKVMDEIYNFS